MEILDNALNEKIASPETELEVTRKYISDRLKQLESQIDPKSWEITNQITRARRSELQNVQLIIGEPKKTVTR